MTIKLDLWILCELWRVLQNCLTLLWCELFRKNIKQNALVVKHLQILRNLTGVPSLKKVDQFSRIDQSRERASIAERSDPRGILTINFRQPNVKVTCHKLKSHSDLIPETASRIVITLVPRCHETRHGRTVLLNQWVCLGQDNRRMVVPLLPKNIQLIWL